MHAEGGCACGAVRYALSEAPLFVHACHCRDCQRYSGSAFVLIGVVEEQTFSVTGDLTVTTRPTPSGDGVEVSFCPQCGTYIWFKYLFTGLPLLALRSGTLDAPDSAPPQAHIFAKSKQPWLELGGDIPAFDEFYDFDTAWPARSRERLAALREAAGG